MTLPLQKNLIDVITAPADCVADPLKDQLVNAIIKSIGANWLEDDYVVPHYLKRYREWIESTQLNRVLGLDNFPSVTYSQGTTESFDKFYLRNRNRRFRCFRGEYLYHELTWQNLGYDWAYIDDQELQANDAVVFSLPFADTGNQKHTQELLDTCVSLDIPVLIDSAFFGICSDIDFDYSHPAITDVTMSLSKPFPVYGMRIGIRFSKDTTDGLNIYGNTHYVNKFGAAVGIQLFNRQTPDYIFARYRDQQLAWCEKYNLAASNCVTFGLDYNHRYDNHNRGSADSNRICFAKFFNKGHLPL